MLLQIHGSGKDLGGGFRVSRLLPSSDRRSVGPFVFMDHFGPTIVEPGMNIDVRPHPHIGLATVTYLFEGAVMHRDSLGSAQRIEPGAINWMTAGRGIVHSERTPEDLRQKTYRTHGLQLWVGLPADLEEVEPSFIHTPAERIASVTEQGVEVRILVGKAFGHVSPVESLSRTLFLTLKLRADTEFVLPPLASEVAIYPLSRDLCIEGQNVQRGTLAVLERRQGVTLHAKDGGEIVVLGGDPLDGPRRLWWNFVSSRKERMRQAADDWAHQRMGRIAGDDEAIPLPAQDPG